ncbi:MAG: hypothetical protein AB9869_28475 [Verrucomicrobiia bacterium]
MNGARAIAENILGEVDWRDNSTGYCSCPGKACHTTRDGRRDAIVHLDGAPGVYCFHASCQTAVAEANRALRRALTTGEATRAYRPSLDQIKARQAREAREAQLRQQARETLTSIVEQPWSPADMAESSPIRLSDTPEDDWRLLLENLYEAADVIWCGAVTDSCTDDASPERKAACARHFRTVAEWLQESEAPGQFTCPSTFIEGAHSRSNGNVIATPYLVVESDTLSKPEIGAVFRWLSNYLNLRAVIDTAGKSLHGWFERPDPQQEARLRVTLPEMGCDPALFKLSQPCRMPGAIRGDRRQQLLYLQ